MSFWQYVSLKIAQYFGARSKNVGAVVLGPPAYSIQVENPAPDPPSIGEMANQYGVSLGKIVNKVFEPIKWVIYGITAVMVLWMIMGLRKK